MFASSMFEADRRAWEQAPRISHWVFDSVPGQISGCDGEGRVLMAIATDPFFGVRLAAAFDSNVVVQRPTEWRSAGTRPPPAFPF
eukprot:m.24070 g.24070  ORF g.24070 m.24070 type:complete len:85 (+) comp35823_c0_seq2:182-436(+)